MYTQWFMCDKSKGHCPEITPFHLYLDTEASIHPKLLLEVNKKNVYEINQLLFIPKSGSTLDFPFYRFKGLLHTGMPILQKTL